MPVSAAHLAGLSRQELVELVVELTAQVEQGQAQLTSLGGQVTVLLTRVVELERQKAGNSSNSSRPPSGDAFVKAPPKSTRKPSGRKPGAQPGSPGVTRRQVDDPDVVVEHVPVGCTGCGDSLAQAPVVGVAARQVGDLPAQRMIWTEHQLQTRSCGCGRATTAGPGNESVRLAPAPAGAPAGAHAGAAAGASERGDANADADVVADAGQGLQVPVMPAWATGPVCYGPGVRAVAAYLSRHHVPVARVAQIMSDLLGAPVAVGSVHAWLADGACQLQVSGGFVEAVGAQLLASPVLHADETGIRINGSRGWVHTLVTTSLTLLGVHPSRGKDAVAAMGVLERYTGTLVHDCWPMYFTATDPTAEHALCCAHLVRELTGVWEASGIAVAKSLPGAVAQTWARDLITVLEELLGAAHDARAAGAEQLDPTVLAAGNARVDVLVRRGWYQNPPPTSAGWPAAGRTRRPVAVNLLDRFERHRGNFLRFATDLGVPYTNNLAETSIRPVKITMNVSHGMRTLAGARAVMTLRSYTDTASKQASTSWASYATSTPATPGSPHQPPPEQSRFETDQQTGEINAAVPLCQLLDRSYQQPEDSLIHQHPEEDVHPFWNRLAETAAARLGREVRLDPVLPGGVVLGEGTRRSADLVRSLIRKQRLAFLGSGTKVIGLRGLTLGRGAAVGENCIIDARGSVGVRLADGAKLGRGGIIMTTSHLSRYGKGVSIGPRSGVADFFHIGASGGVIIGADVIIGPFLTVHSQEHNFEDPKRPIAQQGVRASEVVIGDDCWLGSRVTLLAGTKLSERTVVASGAVVRGSFGPNVLIGGIPAKVIKSI